MMLAILGMVIYSWAVEADKKAVKMPVFRSSDISDGEDVKLLKQKGSKGLADSDLENSQMKT